MNFKIGQEDKLRGRQLHNVGYKTPLKLEATFWRFDFISSLYKED